MQVAVLVVHVLAALGLVALVLLQHGKGADMGAAFGSGSAGSLFGSSGSSNFLSRSTAVFAVIFFLSSMGLSYMSFERATAVGVMDDGVILNQEIPAVSEDVDLQDNIPAPTSGPGQAREEDSRVDEIPE